MSAFTFALPRPLAPSTRRIRPRLSRRHASPLRRSPPHPRARPSLSPTCSFNDPPEKASPFEDALEGLLLEALRTYYNGMPYFTDAEFNTLRDELHHLGRAQLRLDDMEKIWVQATSSRDFDRTLCREFDLSEDELNSLKSTLRSTGAALKPFVQSRKPHPKVSPANQPPASPPVGKKLAPERANVSDASVEDPVKWFLFSDATEERFKIMLLYLPAVVMCFVTASVLTILFALLDGEMKISVTNAGRFRLGILSYVVVMLTFYFSKNVTPFMLDYLDLGQPSLLRGACPVCNGPVSCLFTGAVRNRDERRCGTCGSLIGFNRRWNKLFLVKPPGSQRKQSPD